MTRFRFRFRTIMITVAVLAVLMGLVRLFPVDFVAFFGQIAPIAFIAGFFKRAGDHSWKVDRPVGKAERKSGREPRNVCVENGMESDQRRLLLLRAGACMARPMTTG